MSSQFPNPTSNSGMQNEGSVGISAHCVHIFARLAPTHMLSQCLVTKFMHRSSRGSLLRVCCWLGWRLKLVTIFGSPPPPSFPNPICGFCSDDVCADTFFPPEKYPEKMRRHSSRGRKRGRGMKCHHRLFFLKKRRRRRRRFPRKGQRNCFFFFFLFFFGCRHVQSHLFFGVFSSFLFSPSSCFHQIFACSHEQKRRESAPHAREATVAFLKLSLKILAVKKEGPKIC